MEPNDEDVEMATLLKDEGSRRRSSAESASSETDQTRRRRAKHQEVDAATNGSFEQFYKPVEEYEGRHRYDPHFHWKPADERQVVRKVRRRSPLAIEQTGSNEKYRSMCASVRGSA